MSGAEIRPSANHVALRPRARIIRTLGEELISSEIVAIIELVKNSYDADATKVLIRFHDPIEGDVSRLPLPGTVEVVDNGNGMTLDVVQGAWMEPATYIKKREPRSSRKGRRVLGEKGIGRFAASRLATELELMTRSSESNREVYGIFDWTQFDDENLYLDEVLLLVEDRQPQEICAAGSIDLLGKEWPSSGVSDGRHGTILRMKGLKRSWTRLQFEQLRRGLARLVSPFREELDFLIHLDLPERFGDLSEQVEPPRIIEYPHYSVIGSVDEQGKCKLTIRVEAEGKDLRTEGRFVRVEPGPQGMRKLAPDAEVPEHSAVPTCGPFAVELRVWDRDELGNIRQQTGSTIAHIRRDLDAIAGINIYRDGFRVLPYGEPRNDWLRLDIRRVQNPTLRLSNNQIAGYIAISSDSNPDLRDQSNREGLDENPALEDLRDTMTLILAELEKERFEARHEKDIRKDRATSVGLFAALNFKGLREYLLAHHPEDKHGQQLVDQVEEEFGGRIRQIQAVLSRYHSLATLGQLIDVLLHDGRHPIASIRNQALLGKEDIEAVQEQPPILAKLHDRLEKIEEQGNVLHTVFRRVEPFGGRKRGRPAKLYLEKIIEQSFGVFATELARLGVRFRLPESQTLVSVDEAEMMEVITNLLTNSFYWLQQVDKNRREIIMEVERVAPDHVEILFADSGPGIPAKNHDLIFEPYFSTKPDGVGLGLSIAGEIISDYYRGQLDLLDAGPLPGAVFRIVLRKRV